MFLHNPKIHSFLTFLFVVSFGNLFSQQDQPYSFYQDENPDYENQCATHSIHEQLLMEDAYYLQEYEENERLIRDIIDGSVDVGAKRDQILTVPIVVHIIHTGQAVGSGANISDEQVYSAIQALNEDYRRMPGTYGYGNGVDLEIEFCLAVRDPDGNATNGINRVNGSSVPNYATQGITAGQGQGANEMAVKNLSRWPNNQYYNIWIVTEIENNNGGSGIQGYAYYPTTSMVDGAVILYNAFGTVGNLKSYTNRNKTTTHELGHAFNLYHTFQGNSCVESNCSFYGDRVCDTPPTTQNPNCASPACGGTQNVNNYMDYTSQLCKNMFTDGQRSRARAALLGPRSSLLSSLACEPVSSGPVPVAEFTGSSTNICQGESISFTNQCTGSPDSWFWEFEGGTPSTSTAQNPSNITYNSSGTFNVKLTATNANGNNIKVKNNYITVNPGTVWYADNDGDGHGNPNSTTIACSQPSGYVNAGDDCNDNNSNSWNSCYDCLGVMWGTAQLDNCGTCDSNSSNDCVQDCSGVWGGNAQMDNCGTCDTNPSNDCVQDCAGVWGGNAQMDNCGTCDTNPSNDCVQDCAGVWGGNAQMDNCGTCDTNPSNDCVQDCAGVWGGNAQMDNCGTCDTNPSNDCVQDCAGVWGGNAQMDNCGTCDTNPSNDCVQDCAGVWGGNAQMDNCGTCDTNTSNDCVQDCAGVWGGNAQMDNCGTCDTNPSNDCVQDCAGVWGGNAQMDNCGTCDNDPTNDCTVDCAGVYNGNSTMDNCGVCDDDPTNDCVQDCAGVWGGNAQMDNCGTCDTNPSNDCEQDCAGVWGGNAQMDNCGTCDNDPTNDCTVDCAGVYNGNSTMDNCGVCDDDPTNDCVQDCAGVWGGNAQMDNCGTCDNDPSNDCTVDCAGVYNGNSTMDNCGVCDDDPTNDCVQDCAGVWGGNAQMDNCGTCDTNPSNDCVQDCAGVWGGNAQMDNCGTCDTNPSNDCVQDCAGVWGGNALMDNCGTCDTNPSNDCVQDCAGVWGGNALMDSCGVCDDNPENDCTPCDENFTVTVGVLQQVTCNGGNNGSAQVNATGGATPYIVSWSHNSSLTLPLATGIAAGNHSVIVTDANGCTATATYTIFQPTAVTVTSVETTHATCGEADGTISIGLTGGNAPYNVQWNDQQQQEGMTASNLSAGTYQATVTDNNNCTSVFTFTLDQEDCPEIGTTSLNPGYCNIFDFKPTDYIFAIEVETAIQYEWRFEHLLSGNTIFQITEGAGIVLSDLELIPGEIYNVQIRIETEDGWGEFGELCPISLMYEVPQTGLTDFWCSNSYVYPWDALVANEVEGAQAYEWKVITLGFGTVQLFNTGTEPVLQMSEFTSLDDNESFSISLRIKMNDIWGEFGEACNIKTGNLTPDIIDPVCESTVSIFDTISCNIVAPATNYKWEFTDNEDGAIHTHYSNASNKVWLINVAGIKFNRSYSVFVTPYVNDTWMDEGATCEINVSDYIPPTHIDAYDCGNLNFHNGDKISVEPMKEAKRYLFHFRQVGTDTTHLIFSNYNENWIDIEDLHELKPHTLYMVKARAQVRDKWGAWGSECEFAIGGLTSGEETQPYQETVLYPNPGNGKSVMLSGVTHFDNNAPIRVYDAAGRLVHQQNVVSDNSSTEVTIQFPVKLNAGIYMVHVELYREPVIFKYIVN